MVVVGRSVDGTLVGAVSARDPEEDVLVFAVVGPLGTCPVTLWPNGTLVVNTTQGPVDHEAMPRCTLAVSACEAATAQRLCSNVSGMVEVWIGDVNEAPVLEAQSLVWSVGEDSGVGRAVGVVSSLDPDVGDTAAFAVVMEAVGATGAPFGVLRNGTVVVSGPLDAEARPWHTLAVRVSDSGGLSAVGVVNVSVVDVNSAPVVACGPGSGSSGAQVEVVQHWAGPVGVDGPVVVEDPDAADVVSAVVVASSAPGLGFTVSLTPWSVTAPTASHVQRFVVEVAVGGDPEPGTYWLTVGARDSTGAHSLSLCNVTVRVVDVNDPPVFTPVSGPRVATVSEGAVAGVVVAELGVRDPDVGQGVQCSVVSAVSAGTGAVVDVAVFAGEVVAPRVCGVVVAAPLLDYEVCAQYNVSVMVTDGEFADVAVVTVSVNDTADVPVVLGVAVASASSVLRTLGPLVTGGAGGVGAGAGGTGGEVSTAGGDVVVVRGLHLGSRAPGGFLPSSLPPSAGVRVAYWDNATSPVLVLNTTQCVVVSGGSGSESVVQCGVSAGVGAVTSVRVEVGPQSSEVFGVAGVRYSAPVVRSVEPVLLDTGGGEVVRVRGVGFGPAWLGVERVVRLGSVVLSSCNVTESDVELTCVSGAGGAAARGPTAVTVGVGGVVSWAPVARYRRPCVSSVTVASADGAASSEGGDVVVIRGREFGAVGTVVDWAVYGRDVVLASEAAVDNVTAGVEARGPWSLWGSGATGAASSRVYVGGNCSVTSGHVEVTCVSVPGVGVGHVWAVSIGGAVSSLCEGSFLGAVTTRYGAPVVVSVWVGSRPGVPSGGLDTEGGTVVEVRGVNLGSTGSGVVWLGGVAVGPLIVVTPGVGRFVAPAGVGGGHVVVVDVGGVASSGNVSVSYGPPVVTSVVVDTGE